MAFAEQKSWRKVCASTDSAARHHAGEICRTVLERHERAHQNYFHQPHHQPHGVDLSGERDLPTGARSRNTFHCGWGACSGSHSVELA